MVNSALPSEATHGANDISRKALVLPAAIPIGIISVVLLLDVLGGNFNPHGLAGIVVILVIVGSIGAMLLELYLVTRAIRKLATVPALRTPQNLIAICFGGSFAVFVLLYGMRVALVG
jgi:hypothetical protein